MLLPSAACSNEARRRWSSGGQPGNSTGSGNDASAKGVDGAVCERGLPCMGCKLVERLCRCAETCGERSISFMTAISDVADCTAASCRAMECSMPLSPYFEGKSGPESSVRGMGLRCDFELPCQRVSDISQHLRPHCCTFDVREYSNPLMEMHSTGMGTTPFARNASAALRRSPFVQVLKNRFDMIRPTS